MKRAWKILVVVCSLLCSMFFCVGVSAERIIGNVDTNLIGMADRGVLVKVGGSYDLGSNVTGAKLWYGDGCRVVKSRTKYLVKGDTKARLDMVSITRKGLSKKENVIINFYENSEMVGTPKNITIGYGKKITLSDAIPKYCSISYVSSSPKIIKVSGKSLKAVGYGSSKITGTVKFMGKVVKTFSRIVKCVKPSSTRLTSVRVRQLSIGRLYVGVPLSKDRFEVFGTYKGSSTEKKLTNYTMKYKSVPSKEGYAYVVFTVPGFSKSIELKVYVYGSARRSTGLVVKNIKTSYLNRSSFPFRAAEFYRKYASGSEVRITNPKEVSVTVTVSKKTSDYTDYRFVVKDLVDNRTLNRTVRVYTDPNYNKEVLVGARCVLDPSWLYVGENLKSGQIKVTGTFKKQGKTYTKAIKNFTTNFSPKSAPGKYTVIVYIKNLGNTYTFNLSLTVKNKEATLKSFSVKAKRNIFFLDDKPTKNDFKVIGTYSDGTKLPISNYTITYIPAKVHKGDGEIRITVNGTTSVLKVKCYDRNCYKRLSVEISRAVLRVGEKMERKYIKLTGTTYDDREVTVTNYTLSWTSQYKKGTYPLTISAGGMSLTVEIEVI